jgi:hypothetical protein
LYCLPKICRKVRGMWRRTDGPFVCLFLLSSHSNFIFVLFWPAAWGELQNGQWGETFKIFHWELGVFLSPSTLGTDRILPFVIKPDQETTTTTTTTTNNTVVRIPLPYKFHPERYSSNDQPWTVDGL